MPSKRLISAACALILASSVQAAGDAPAIEKQIVEFKSDPVVLYEDQSGAQVAARVPRGDIPVPLRVRQEEGDYVMLRFGERDLWVSNLKTRLDFPPAHCTRHRQAGTVGASRAIGEGCAKE